MMKCHVKMEPLISSSDDDRRLRRKKKERFNNSLPSKSAILRAAGTDHRSASLDSWSHLCKQCNRLFETKEFLGMENYFF